MAKCKLEDKTFLSAAEKSLILAHKNIQMHIEKDGVYIENVNDYCHTMQILEENNLLTLSDLKNGLIEIQKSLNMDKAKIENYDFISTQKRVMIICDENKSLYLIKKNDGYFLNARDTSKNNCKKLYKKIISFYISSDNSIFKNILENSNDKVYSKDKSSYLEFIENGNGCNLNVICNKNDCGDVILTNFSNSKFLDAIYDSIKNINEKETSKEFIKR